MFQFVYKMFKCVIFLKSWSSTNLKHWNIKWGKKCVLSLVTVVF